MPAEICGEARDGEVGMVFGVVVVAVLFWPMYANQHMQVYFSLKIVQSFIV